MTALDTLGLDTLRWLAAGALGVAAAVLSYFLLDAIVSLLGRMRLFWQRFSPSAFALCIRPLHSRGLHEDFTTAAALDTGPPAAIME